MVIKMKIIYYNANIITMNEKQPRAKALMIEDGKIVEIGTNEEIFQFHKESNEMIDCHGKTILPGFIDAHSHFIGFANSLAQCNCASAQSFDDMIFLMKQFIRDNHIEEGEWVIGSNYDHNDLIEQAHPTKDVLDQISTTHPIVLVHASSHMGVANSLALRKQQLSDKTIDPEGGKYGRDDGNLNGYMEENAFISFQNQLPLPTVDHLMELIEKTQHIYAKYGITTIQDGMVTPPVLGLLQEASKRKCLFLDVVGYVDLNHSRLLMQSNDNNYHDHLRLGGYKIFLDGSPQGKTAWVSQPYLNSNDCGYPTLHDEHLYDLITQALDDHQQLLAHCNGDAAAEQYITQFEKAKEHYTELYRPVMVHAQLVRDDQLERMKPCGMIPSFFVAHTYYWGDVHIKNLGFERASKISPAHCAKTLNLPFTFHQDSPVIQPNMLETIQCATQRMTKKGVVLGEEERISTYDALKAITINAAYQYHEENQKGSLEKGKIADFVILNKNPLEDLNHSEVIQTIKEGKIIYQR